MAGCIAAKAIREGLSASSEEIPDEELLARFLDDEGTSSQDAFRVLVGRHGPRVLGICRHILDREHDAEDAFQATFLALARSGATIRDRCALGGWLQEVAYRTSLKTRMRQSRRRTMEKQVRAMAPAPDASGNPYESAALDEIKPVLQEEVTGLPDKYRIPVVLSYMEGKTNEEVAELLHWPVGTVKGRLARAGAAPLAADAPRGRPEHDRPADAPVPIPGRRGRGLGRAVAQDPGTGDRARVVVDGGRTARVFILRAWDGRDPARATGRAASREEGPEETAAGPAGHDRRPAGGLPHGRPRRGIRVRRRVRGDLPEPAVRALGAHAVVPARSRRRRSLSPRGDPLRGRERIDSG